MSEYVFRYASGYGCDMSALMDGGRVTVGEYFASDAADHYGTLHEEIIRCRDCKFCKPNKGKFKKDFPMWCEFIELDMGDADAFCAWGERRGK